VYRVDVAVFGTQKGRLGWDGSKAKDDFLSLAFAEKKAGNHPGEKTQTATTKTLVGVSIPSRSNSKN
jgi:hypothetical protein